MQVSKNVIEFKNIVRGRKQYRHARHKISAKILKAGAHVVGGLNPYLQKELFELKKDNWFALAFDSKDWKTLKTLREGNRSHYDEQYLELLVGYITANEARIQKMYAYSSVVSSAILDNNVDKVLEEIEKLEFSNAQSLFV